MQSDLSTGRPTGDSVEFISTMQFLVLASKLPWFDHYLEIYHTMMSCLEWQILSIGDVIFERPGWEAFLVKWTGFSVDIKQAESLFVGSSIIILVSLIRIYLWMRITRKLHKARGIG